MGILYAFVFVYKFFVSLRSESFFNAICTNGLLFSYTHGIMSSEYCEWLIPQLLMPSEHAANMTKPKICFILNSFARAGPVPEI